MSDTASANVTAQPPASTLATPGDNLAEVRTGFASVVLLAALFILGVAVYTLYYAGSIAALPDGNESWWTSVKHKSVWPTAAWGLLFGLFGLALGALLLTNNKAEANTPAWLSKMFGIALVGAALAYGAILIYLPVTRTFQTSLTWFFIWSFVGFGITVGSGFWLVAEAPRQESSRLRLILLGVGLSLGAITFLLGIALAIFTFWEDFRKGIDTWRQQPAVLIWPVAAYLSGLALVFASIQPAATLVRADQNIRRIVFGANLAVVSLLLLGVLLLPNVLAYAEPLSRVAGRGYDWTDSGLHALQTSTRNVVAGIREPVKVYVVLPRDFPHTNDTITLLENARSQNANLSYELVDIRSPATRERRVEFMRKYNLADPQGLLIVGGTGEKGEYAFVKETDLFDNLRRPRGDDAGGYTYKGERAFRNALLSLAEGKVTIYFTTGHGELSLDDPMMGKMMKKGPRGGELNALQGKIATRDSITVKPLHIDRGTKEIPADATVVVIARPTQPFSKEEVEVLSQYLSREGKKSQSKDKEKEKEKARGEDVEPGRLFLLLDPIVQVTEGKSIVAPTGLGGLLAMYNVKIGDNKILSVATRGAPRRHPDDYRRRGEEPDQQDVQRRGDSADDLPIQQLPDGRSDRSPGRQGGRAAVVVAAAIGQLGLDRLRQRHGAVPQSAAGRQETVVRDDQQAAAERGGAGVGSRSDARHAAGRRPRTVGGKETPRMVVFGTSSWITDDALAGNLGAERAALFNSCVTWLHGKSENFADGTEPDDKTRKMYNLNITPENQTRLQWLPLGMMMTAVFVIGMGVWVVRRR